MTHRALLSLAAGTVLSLAGPALAQSSAPRANAPSAPEAAQSGEDAESGRRICVLQETTGTRLQRRVCRTRAQWEREGGVPGEESR